jgi:hypothetical protein
MSTTLDTSLPAAKRKRTGNLLLSDYPLAASTTPVVSFFGYSVAPPPTVSAATQTQGTAQTHTQVPRRRPEDNHFAWSFLSHPILQHLRKWPGLDPDDHKDSSSLPASIITTAPEHQSAPPKPELAPQSTALNLLKLLEIPPIASSLTSYLYGHDLLALRTLNRSFQAALSTQSSEEGNHSYYHMLLLKSMLCSRNDTATEPFGTACKSAGGNVGPCMLCARVICGVRRLCSVASEERKLM